ncbi:Sulfotransfer-1 domain-containing protein [Aphelenchoides besseyi]|nr:Sulfotransfer-1 domain-containing protein [Aphelenchoides besseyi]KAI6201685.1 Sulfotransfer-1 domain-containing protein [Aphelenchoides besseyi]
MLKCTGQFARITWFCYLICCVITIGHSTEVHNETNPRSNQTVGSEKRQHFPVGIVIGVKKSGTRALLEFLKINPRIAAPSAEIHFFDKNYDKGLEYYRKQMPFTTDDQITIEKSPAYFVSKFVPQRVYKMNPKIKLIVVVRNPITRAISDYTQTVTRRKRSLFPTNTFEEMSRCGNNTKCVNGINTSWGAVRIGVYYKYLKNWLRYFPISQFLFVDGERLIRSPASEIRQVERFLGLQPVVRDDDFIIDPIKKFPCVRRVESKTPRCLGKSKGRTHPDVDPELIGRLQDFYRPENEKFFQLINRYFHWY